MKYYIITGASKGIGKALAEELLKHENTCVIGVSRTSSITHPNYRHQPLDLSDLDAVENNLHRIFLPFADATRLVLVNNAGVLGDIGYIGEQSHENFEFVFDVNVVSPAILMNAFLKKYSDYECDMLILNISSGAGKYPVDGWASYCASKAALDMLSLTAQQEQDLRQTGVKVLSLAPGVVDTAMQEHIREADALRFSSVQKFKDYKNNGDLSDAAEVATKLVKLLNNLPEPHEVVMRL